MSASPGVPEPASDVSEPVLEPVEEEETGGSDSTGELAAVVWEGGVPWFFLCLC